MPNGHSIIPAQLKNHAGKWVSGRGFIVPIMDDGDQESQKKNLEPDDHSCYPNRSIPGKYIICSYGRWPTKSQMNLDAELRLSSGVHHLVDSLRYLSR